MITFVSGLVSLYILVSLYPCHTLQTCCAASPSTKELSYETSMDHIAMCLRVLRDVLEFHKYRIDIIISGGRALLQAKGLWLKQRQWGSRRDTNI